MPSKLQFQFEKWKFGDVQMRYNQTWVCQSFGYTGKVLWECSNPFRTYSKILFRISGCTPLLYLRWLRLVFFSQFLFWKLFIWRSFKSIFKKWKQNTLFNKKSKFQQHDAASLPFLIYICQKFTGYFKIVHYKGHLSSRWLFYGTRMYGMHLIGHSFPFLLTRLMFFYRKVVFKPPKYRCFLFY